jgi:two-component system, NarL family, sensor kinase
MTKPEVRIIVPLFTLLLVVLPLLCPAVSISTPQLIQQAEKYQELDQLDSAVLVYQKAIDQATLKKQKQHLLQANLGLASTYFYQGDFPRAKDQLETCEGAANHATDRAYLLQVWLIWAEVLFAEGSWPEAESRLSMLEERAVPTRDQMPLAKGYNLWAKICSQQGKADLANAYLKKGKTLALQLPDKALAIDLLNQLATNYKNQDGALIKAQGYLEELIQLREKTKDERSLIGDHQELADLLRQTGDLPHAQKQLLKALKLAQSIRDTLQQMELLVSIAKGYLVQNQMATAEEYLQRSLLMAVAKKNEFKASEIRRLRGQNLEKSGKYDQGLTFYKAALLGFQHLGNDLECGRTLALFHQNSASQQALVYFGNALTTKIANHETLGEVEIRLEMAKIQLELKDGAAALVNLKNCASLATQAGNRAYLLATLDALAKANALEGNFNAAYVFAERHQNLKDSIFNADQTRIISEMNARFDNAALRDSLQVTEIAKNRAELRQKNQLNYLLGGALLAGVLIALLLFQIYRTRTEQRLQAQQLAALEKQREADQLRSMINGEEQERKRIAQELHDGLGTLLATVKLQFNAVQNELPEIDANRSYQKADNLLDEACTEVRQISYNLMPAILQQYGLEFALQDLCEGISRSGRLEISFIPYGLDYPFDDPTAVSIYRIVQELVKNTLRHAEAKELIVQLSIEDAQLSMIIEDDGKGFDVAEKLQNPGIGLQSIQSRLTLLNGSMEVESNPDLGTTFTIDIPLTPNNRGDEQN